MKLDGRGFDSHRLHMKETTKNYIEREIQDKKVLIQTNKFKINEYRSYIEGRENDNLRLVTEVIALEQLIK